MRPYEEHESTVVFPRGVVFKSKSAAGIAAAARWAIALWAQQPRVCVCTPTSRPVLVEPEGSTCYQCSGRVVPRAPFRAGEWA